MDARKTESRFDRLVDLTSVILISAATVLTAWCGYEAARWTSLETKEYNLASFQRISAAASAARGNTLETIDVTAFLQYVEAISAGRNEEVAFLYRRFRPEMRSAVDAWLATKPLKNPAAPASPFAMPQYRLHDTDEAKRYSAQANESFADAENANELGDQYVRLTVIFAAVSFLAGISTRFVFPNHLIAVVVGFGALAFGLIRMFELAIR